MKKIVSIFLCFTTLFAGLYGCASSSENAKDTSAPTEAPTANGDFITEEINILEDYRAYFNDNEVSTENINLTKDVALTYCESFEERGSKSMPSETIEDIKNEIGLDYLRHSAEVTTKFDYVYSIHPAKDSNNEIWYLIFVYNKNGYVIDSFCLNNTPHSWEFSENIEIGKSTYDDVLAIDSNAEIYQEYDGTYISKHRCLAATNVYVIYDKVDDTYIVSDIDYATDPVRFTQNLKYVDGSIFYEADNHQ